MAFIVITGTGTDVGKTISTAAIVHYLHAQGHDVLPVKPVQTGELPGNGDIATITKLTGIEGKEYCRFRDPLAPNLAAQSEGSPQVDEEELLSWLRSFDAPDRIVVIEGAGGLLVRLNDHFTVADIALALDAPLVVVTSTGLGSLNSAELTVEAAQRRGLSVLGLVGGYIDAEPDLATQLNLDEFARVTGVPFLGALEAGLGDLSREEFGRNVDKHAFKVLDQHLIPQPAR